VKAAGKPSNWLARNFGLYMEEYQRYIHLEHPNKSAKVKHIMNLGHCIQPHHTAILSTKPRCKDCIIREATEIKLNPNNMNREDGFRLSKSCKQLISSLKDRRKPPSHDSRSVYTALTRAQNIPSPGTHQPPPRCPSFLPLPLLP
jgi:hypothetical protein